MPERIAQAGRWPERRSSSLSRPFAFPRRAPKVPPEGQVTDDFIRDGDTWAKYGEPGFVGAGGVAAGDRDRVCGSQRGGVAADRAVADGAGERSDLRERHGAD